MNHETLTSLSPGQCLTTCGESIPLDNLAKFWDESVRSDPAEIIRFLDPQVWREAREWGGIGEELDDALERTATRIQESPELLRLFWHCCWRIYLAPEAGPPADWPTFTGILGDDGGLFYLLVSLAAVPLIRKWHAELGIPEDVTRHTAAQVYWRVYVHNSIHGRPGVEKGQLGWIRHYTRERYFRLGRLEFWLAPYKWSERVFRNRQTGAVITLAGDGTRFSAEGRIFGAPENYSEGEGWTATYVQTDTDVEGYLLHPDGHGTSNRVKLSLKEWECLLEEDVMTLQLHIPFGGEMTPEACKASIEFARAFFQEHFPNEPAVAVTCGSWIFGPQLQQCLPETSNLVAFQRELFLVPSPAHGDDGLWFVYLKRGVPDPRTWPRETSVQRAILDHLAKGHIWGAGRMFFLLDDTPRFGQQVYRSAWPPVVLDSSS